MPDFVSRRRLLLGMVGTLAVGVPTLAALAKDSDKDGKDCKRGQDCARDAFKTGEIRPLSEVLAAVKDKVPGEVVKVELEREDGEWVYEVKVLTPNGRRKEVEINAKTLIIKKID